MRYLRSIVPVHCVNEYLTLDIGGYLCTNSLCTAWLNASQRSLDGVLLYRSCVPIFLLLRSTITMGTRRSPVSGQHLFWTFPTHILIHPLHQPVGHHRPQCCHRYFSWDCIIGLLQVYESNRHIFLSFQFLLHWLPQGKHPISSSFPKPLLSFTEFSFHFWSSAILSSRILDTVSIGYRRTYLIQWRIWRFQLIPWFYTFRVTPVTTVVTSHKAPCGCDIFSTSCSYIDNRICDAN